MPFRVAIIGAGPAGCMLARLLAHKSSKTDLEVVLFESEASINFRSQGGTLDLHEQTGLRALKEAGLFDEFLKYARYDGEAIKLADKNLLCYVSSGGGKAGKSKTGRPEIDRPKLRELLYNSLPTGTVRWQHKLSHVGQDGTLHFTNQPSQQGFDLVVGADGGWSKVRPLLTEVKPFFSGVVGHAFSIPNAAKSTPELYKLVNRGSLFAWSGSDGKMLTAQYMGDESLNTNAWAFRSEDWLNNCDYDRHDSKAVKEAVSDDLADWDPRLKAFIQDAQDEVAPRDLYMLPVGHRWDHRPGVTLIGDAAHLMTPFAGEGVNLAFSDCISLADAILESSTLDDLEQHVDAFEQDMFERAKSTTRRTYDAMQHVFTTPGSPRNGIESYLLGVAGDELGYWGTLLATPLVYAYFAIFKLIW